MRATVRTCRLKAHEGSHSGAGQPTAALEKGGTHGGRGWGAKERAQDLQTGSTERYREQSGPRRSRCLPAHGASHAKPCSVVGGGTVGPGPSSQSPGLAGLESQGYQVSPPLPRSAVRASMVPTLCPPLASNSRSETFFLLPSLSFPFQTAALGLRGHRSATVRYHRRVRAGTSRPV